MASPKQSHRDHRLSSEILAGLATLPTTTPPLARLVEWTGRDGPEVVEAVGRLERSGLVESWPNPEDASGRRVMLSGKSSRELGLRLSPRGDRWERDGRGSRADKLEPRRPRRARP